MCLAKPLKIVDIDSEHVTGKVEINGGFLMVGLDLVPETCIGSYVLVHAGMAIEMLDDDDAESILETCEDYVFNENSIIPEENR